MDVELKQQLELGADLDTETAEEETEEGRATGAVTGAPPQAQSVGTGGGARGPTASDQAIDAKPLFGWLKGKGKSKAKKKAKEEPKEVKTPEPEKTPEKPPVRWTTQTVAELIKAKSAAEVFTTIAAATEGDDNVKQGIGVLRSDALFDGVVAKLPTGSAIGKDLRAALYRTLALDAVNIAETRKLFKARFNQDMVDGGGAWTIGTAKVVWRQLDLLPDSDVTDRAVNATFTAVAGGGGMQGSLNIDIGQGADVKHMSHTVRHEIAHGVHDKITGVVDAWLKGEMDFYHFDKDVASVLKWLEETGAFPAEYEDHEGKKQKFDDPAKTKAAEMVESWMGRSQWGPKRPKVADTDERKALWKAMPATMTNAVTQSTEKWYNNYAQFQKVGSRYYFLNHWYHWPFHVGEAAFKIIPATGENYTAMSHYEFFANVYAKFFEDPEGAKDPKKWGGGLPDNVQTFLRQCIIARSPYTGAEDRKKNT